MDFTILHFAIHIVWRANVICTYQKSGIARKTTVAYPELRLIEIRDLVKAIQTPLAVFAYGDKNKSQNLVVDITKEEKNFIVGLSLRPKVGGRVLEINSIRNVFPKDNAEWLNWIKQNKALFIDKERIQKLINQQRTILADVEYLDSIANIVKEFENPISEAGKTYDEEDAKKAMFMKIINNFYEKFTVLLFQKDSVWLLKIQKMELIILRQPSTIIPTRLLGVKSIPFPDARIDIRIEK